MKCPKCGWPLPDDSEFCQYCGTRLPSKSSAMSAVEIPHGLEEKHNNTSVSEQGRIAIDSQQVLMSYRKLSSEQKERFFPGREDQASKVVSSLVYLLGQSASIDKLYELYLTVASRLQLGFSEERIQNSLIDRYPGLLSASADMTIPLIRCIRRITENYSHLSQENKKRLLSVDLLFDSRYAQRFFENEKKQDDAIEKPGFGTSPNNPIYTHGLRSTYDYLNSLYSAEFVPLTWHRVGSVSIDTCVDPLDRYELLLPDGTRFGSVYVNMYSQDTSIHCPKGMKRSAIPLPESGVTAAKEEKRPTEEPYKKALVSEDNTGLHTEKAAKQELQVNAEAGVSVHESEAQHMNSEEKAIKPVASACIPHEPSEKTEVPAQSPGIRSNEQAREAKSEEILCEWTESVSQGNIPVVLERVTLRKNQQGELLLYCTFCPITPEPIRALQVDIKCMDVWREPLPSVIGYQYLDIETKQGILFGETIPINIPDPQTRNVEIVVRRIALSSGKVLLREDDRTTVSDADPIEPKHDDIDKKHGKTNSDSENTKRYFGLPIRAWLIGAVCICVLAAGIYFLIRGKTYSEYPDLGNQIEDEQRVEQTIEQTYSVLLDRMGGINGSGLIHVTNGGNMPQAYAPTKKGYAFKGYYALPNGQGTKYYNAAMERTNAWDKEGGGTIYAFWEKKEEVRFSKDSLAGDPVFIDINSIVPVYGIALAEVCTDFICECETTTGSKVYLLINAPTYRTFFDYHVDTSITNLNENDMITFNHWRRIHGTVIKANSVLTDLSYKTSNLIVEYDSHD